MNTIVLANGITGFYRDVPPPRVNYHEFVTQLYSLSYQHGFKVLKTEEINTLMNFYYVKVEYHREQFYILLNCYYPMIAFAKEIEAFNIDFVDQEDLKEILQEFYQVLTVEELDQQLVRYQKGKKQVIENENDLNEAELDQIGYWNPSTIKDIIFNFWD